jgi:excisionase family DNA binding protein
MTSRPDPDTNQERRSSPLVLGSMPEVLTPTEAAAILRIGRSTMYELIRAGAVPSVRLGRRLIIPRRAVEQLLGSAVSPVDVRAAPVRRPAR